MANGSPANGGKLSGLSYRQAVVLAVVTAVLSGSGVPWFLSALGVNPYRDDPFTGAEGRIIAKRLDSLEFHVANHPDQTNKFDRRITTLEANQRLIIANQERILNRLNQ